MSTSRFPFFRSRKSTGYESFEPKSWTGYGRSRPDAEPLVPFLLDERVSWRFNAYAKFAFPSEIGGMLRIVGDEKDGYRAIDLKIFPHTVAHGTYFELNGEAISTFLMDLVRQGRRDEVGEWRGLVHSHPGFAPHPSGTDRANLLMLASEQHAFSLICSAYPDPERNYHLVHYAQRAPLPMVVNNIPVRASDDGDLSGLGELTDEAIAAIKAEVEAVLPKQPRWQSTYTRERSSGWPYSSRDDEWVTPRMPFEAEKTDPLGLSDDEYAVCDTAIDHALQQCGKGKRRRVEQLLDLRLDIDHQEAISDAQRTLLDEVLTAFALEAATDEERETATALADRLSEDESEPTPAAAPSVDAGALLAKDETKALCRRALHWAQARGDGGFAQRLLSVERALDEERSLTADEIDALQAALDLWSDGAKLRKAERMAAKGVRRALLDAI
jgi:proteasome lid subunit RPN8/RPN11